MSEQEPHDIDKTPLAWFVAPAIGIALTGLWGWAGLIADRDRSWPQLVDSLAASATVAAVAVAAYLLQRVGQRVNRRQITATRAVVDQIASATMGDRATVEVIGSLAAQIEQLAHIVGELVDVVGPEGEKARLRAMLPDVPGANSRPYASLHTLPLKSTS